jgi:hypothetical protein
MQMGRHESCPDFESSDASTRGTGRLMLGILGSLRSSRARAFGSVFTLASRGHGGKVNDSGGDHTV